MKKILTAVFIFLIASALITQIASIYLSSSNALGSIEATKLKASIESIKSENMQLSSEVLAFSSHLAIASHAAGLGYEDRRDIISVYDPVEVAVR